MDNPLVDSGISIHAPREGGDPPVDNVDLTHIPISIHAPREGGDRAECPTCGCIFISIHAPREGGDLLFQRRLNAVLFISIHAPREGGDKWVCPVYPWHRYFNPRPPRGGRRMPNGYSGICLKFQSTPPARGATKKKYNDMLSEDISIHAPREGGDPLKERLVLARF